MIDIESAETHTEAVVRVRLSGTPELAASYPGSMIQPYLVTITYTYFQTRSELDGWMEHSWLARFVTVAGLRVLKPRKDGTQRLGKDVHKAGWSSFGPGDVQTGSNKPLPEWLDALINELRPSGDLRVVGAL